jgi:hypothetical protein
MGPTGCPETSVKDYHSTLRNTPQERRHHQHRGGGLKSLEVLLVFSVEFNKMHDFYFTALQNRTYLSESFLFSELEQYPEAKE